MFQDHFAMQAVPFDRSLACSSLYLSQQFQEASARLRYVCEHRCLGVLTGDVGAGKSTVLRYLKYLLDPTNFQFVYIADSELGPRAFYSLALHQLGVPQPPYSVTRLKTVFRNTVEMMFNNKGITCVFAIDEAQDMTLAMAKELRFILNFQADSHSPLALVLAGQVEFRTTMKTLIMAPVRRRVEATAILRGMTLKETTEYIEHQLRQAGATHPLFPGDVQERIYEHSKGVTAHINALCKRALIDAAARRQKLVEQANVDRAIQEY